MSNGIVHGGTKRKRNFQNESIENDKSILSKAPSIRELERSIHQSRKNWNKIVTLLDIAKKEVENNGQDLDALIASCKVFLRIFSDGHFSTSQQELSDREVVVIEWLRTRLVDYQDLLLRLLCKGDPKSQNIALSLCLELAKSEIINTKNPDNVWKTGFFNSILEALIECPEGTGICHEFGKNYANLYDDIRHQTFWQISHYLSNANHDTNQSKDKRQVVSNSFQILAEMNLPSASKKLNNNFCTDQIISLATHKKLGQKAWLSVLNTGVESTLRKQALRIMTENIVPWFQNVELLMDFLTDSYEVGGATSLLALSGLFTLMQEKNLDYPDFYKKLYSLLDENTLHSKHRSRFFRLMNTFMSSTHLPAALVASFIKRLSRLALHGPPAGIVAIVPWVYNMLKSHPQCTFMIHREPRTEEERQELAEFGIEDPFNMKEEDPMQTNAINSCLWELESLQLHYHPNVASLAKIISEQFTKSSYNLDDFLDHSYATLIETELGREMKKTAVIEYEIPKKIFVQADGDTTLERLMLPILQA